jgi:drug/metabolite transporter (DMT)-like permease
VIKREDSLLQLRVLLPFSIATLIWGTTWFVIVGQFGPVPAAWSVTYRFAIAAAAMFAYAGVTRSPLAIDRNGHLLALICGIPQFCINYNTVYAAERHITSGLVAVIFAMLLVPNSIMARLFLGQRMAGRFILGSAVAAIGIALLFVQEMRTSSASSRDVALGILFTLAAMLAASAANTMQGSKRVQQRSITAMVAWSMVYGVVANALVAWIGDGPPLLDSRPEYWAGLLYLGVLGSALAFALYYKVIRAVGPGTAAYSSLLVPLIAMLVSTLFEGYKWSPLAVGGGLLALIGLVIALRSRTPPTPELAEQEAISTP